MASLACVMKRCRMTDSGHALLVTMMAAAALAPLGAFAAMQTRLDFLLQHHTRAALETFVVAESGLEHALADLALDPRFDRLLLGPDRKAGTTDDGTYPFAHPPPAWFPAAPFRYAVRVTATGPDALELTASAVGPWNAARSVVATVVRDGSPYLPGALMLGASNPVISLATGFQISGAAAAGTDAGLPAIAINGTGAAAALAAQLSPVAAAQLTGRGDPPSIADAAVPSPEDIATTAVRQAAGPALASEVHGNIGDGLFVSPAALRLVDASGSGMLVVQGALQLSGTIAFSGVIVALGGLQADADSHSAIDGAVLVGTRGTMIALRGDGHLAYDGQIVRNVNREFPGLLPNRARVTGWHEYADATS